MGTHPDNQWLIGQIEAGKELGAYEAVKQLSGVLRKDAIVALGRILRTGSRSYARQAAAYALSFNGGHHAFRPLFECATDEREEEAIRAAAIEGLAMHLRWATGKSSRRRKAEDLMIGLLKSPSAELRFWSCFGLGQLKCRRANPELRRLIREDQEVYPGWWHVREEAEDALEWIAGRLGTDRIPVHKRNPSVFGSGDTSAKDSAVAPSQYMI